MVSLAIAIYFILFCFVDIYFGWVAQSIIAIGKCECDGNMAVGCIGSFVYHFGWIVTIQRQCLKILLVRVRDEVQVV